MGTIYSKNYTTAIKKNETWTLTFEFHKSFLTDFFCLIIHYYLSYRCAEQQSTRSDKRILIAVINKLA